eukprot:6192699-Pleurochrysis_carterae.AAC.2
MIELSSESRSLPTEFREEASATRTTVNNLLCRHASARVHASMHGKLFTAQVSLACCRVSFAGTESSSESPRALSARA